MVDSEREFRAIGPARFEVFEWDERKRRSNLKRHGIDFRDLDRFFDGVVLAARSDQKDEVRWIAVGFLDKRVISVIYTQRSETCRIISARPARRKERAAYHARYA
jgi:hypothetical protein